MYNFLGPPCRWEFWCHFNWVTMYVYVLSSNIDDIDSNVHTSNRANLCDYSSILTVCVSHGNHIAFRNAIWIRPTILESFVVWPNLITYDRRLTIGKRPNLFTLPAQFGLSYRFYFYIFTRNFPFQPNAYFDWHASQLHPNSFVNECHCHIMGFNHNSVSVETASNRIKYNRGKLCVTKQNFRLHYFGGYFSTAIPQAYNPWCFSTVDIEQ